MHNYLCKQKQLNMRNVFVILLIILLGFGTNCYADGKKYWQKKHEQYEQAKKDAMQKGETFDPNEYNRKERQRIEENSMSPTTVVLILVGIVAIIGGIVVVTSNIGEAIKNNTPEGRFWMLILGIIGVIILIAILIAVGDVKSSGSNYNSDEEYWENSRMHTDRHY